MEQLWTHTKNLALFEKFWESTKVTIQQTILATTKYKHYSNLDSDQAVIYYIQPT